MTEEKLKEILEKHRMWLSGEKGGKQSDLRGADLQGTNLSGSDMRCANLQGAKIDDITAARLMACPSTGAFTGWKKADGYIIKLLIPEDAKRSSATTRKCRCDKAEVLAIEMLDGTESGMTELRHMAYRHETVYKVGETVYPDSWDDDRWNECSHGIHFFITREEAVAYDF